MNSEKGFATVLALCLILVIALVVKGIQESEMNHAREATDFQIEFELQNAADGGIYEAAEIVRVAKENGETLLSFDESYQLVSRTKNISSGTIQLTVMGKLTSIQPYKMDYSPNKKTAIKTDLDDDGYADDEIFYDGYALLSAATFTEKETGVKKFRRAFAYVRDDDETTIHFLETFSGQ